MQKRLHESPSAHRLQKQSAHQLRDCHFIRVNLTAHPADSYKTVSFTFLLLASDPSSTGYSSGPLLLD
jgi:hypothetical protein